VIVTSAPRERAGGASGMQSTARLTGQSLGAALVAVIFGLTHGLGPERAVTLSLSCAVALSVIGGCASVLRRGRSG
jgi:DHA2 family multidrug resistance protein-like MFS transporter